MDEDEQKLLHLWYEQINGLTTILDTHKTVYCNSRGLLL